MSSVALYRASGLALLLWFLLVLSGFVMRALVVPGIPTPTQLASASFVSSNVLIFSGLGLLLFGWLGIIARLAELSGWLGLAGAFLLFLSGVVFAGINAVNWLAAPRLAVHAPRNVAAEVGSGTPFGFFCGNLAGLGRGGAGRVGDAAGQATLSVGRRARHCCGRPLSRRLFRELWPRVL